MLQLSKRSKKLMKDLTRKSNVMTNKLSEKKTKLRKHPKSKKFKNKTLNHLSNDVGRERLLQSSQ
jgi:hypothetical protein